MSRPDPFRELRKALADMPRVERWFVVGAPWGKGDFIVAGHQSPYLGRYVADTEHFDGEDVLENAAFIAAANPFTIRLLLAELDALRSAAATVRLATAQDLGTDVLFDTREFAATGRAMAAAGEMLAALQAVADKLGSRPYGTGSYLPKPLRDQVFAAIAKAMGQEGGAQ